jgi:hypothetical protein
VGYDDSMRRSAFFFAAAFLSSVACTPGDSECVEDTDCESGEVCRALQESDDRVCIRDVVDTDAGPEEEGDPVAISSFTATPNPIARGGTLTLEWESANATSCAINNGVGGVDGSGTTTVTVDDSVRYSLSCQGVDGPAVESIDVDVEVEVVTLTLTPSEANVAQEITADWTTVGATSCTLTAGAINYTVPAADLGEGSTTFFAESSGDVELSCAGANGPGTKTAALSVARVITFTATPATITSGGTSTLAWTTENVTGCAVQGETDPSPGDDMIDVMPTTTTAYTLDCTGYGDAEILATVEVTVE